MFRQWCCTANDILTVLAYTAKIVINALQPVSIFIPTPSNAPSIGCLPHKNHFTPHNINKECVGSFFYTSLTYEQCWGSESESESERIRTFWRIRIRIQIRSNHYVFSTWVWFMRPRIQPPGSSVVRSGGFSSNSPAPPLPHTPSGSKSTNSPGPPPTLPNTAICTGKFRNRQGSERYII